jgi:capsular exopolysaccharide synthesis family protein
MVIVFCLAYYREWRDTSLKTLDDVRNSISAPLMGTVPTFASTQDSDRLARERGLSPALCYYHRPGSREAESFRSIRTTLFVSMQQGQKVIQVSSAEPGDGKSTSAANLAIAAAQSGKRVLLVDADLRRPTQHELFQDPQEIGLSDVLLQEIDWHNAIRETPVDGLSLLGAGLCPENPAELLSGRELGKFLGEARGEWDLIIIDSPPVLAVSDPCIIAPETDGMLLVIRMFKSRRPAMARLQETLAAHGVHLFGVMANDFKSSLAYEAGFDYDAYGTYYSASQSPHPVRNSIVSDAAQPVSSR